MILSLWFYKNVRHEMRIDLLSGERFMEKLIKIVTIALLLFFVAATAQATQDGTVGGGGGHTINGKPMEWYINRDGENTNADITTYSSYKKIVSPLLAKLDVILPSFARDLKKTITDKTWYFVPVKLNSSEIQFVTSGIPFDA